ncbi:hypothetical protein FBR03_03660 [Betaproteobacteria bacterium PRO1]|nr:hypothetical protein [Burkholderiaceae bacterium]MCZ2099308.1 hypothetical protein [Anaerolineae bacterium]MDL1906554.1 hypothetical protein [Betaproteobacteria bacterium PRO1]
MPDDEFAAHPRAAGVFRPAERDFDRLLHALQRQRPARKAATGSALRMSVARNVAWGCRAKSNYWVP